MTAVFFSSFWLCQLHLCIDKIMMAAYKESKAVLKGRGKEGKMGSRGGGV